MALFNFKSNCKFLVFFQCSHTLNLYTNLRMKNFLFKRARLCNTWSPRLMEKLSPSPSCAFTFRWQASLSKTLQYSLIHCILWSIEGDQVLKCKAAVFVLGSPEQLYGHNLQLPSWDLYSFLCFHIKRYVRGTQATVATACGGLATLAELATADSHLKKSSYRDNATYSVTPQDMQKTQAVSWSSRKQTQLYVQLQQSWRTESPSLT